jgi:hypothetical protein
MSQSPFVRPRRIAGWFVDLFIPNEQAGSIPGELLEEFSNVASKSGLASARRWYWRQSAKTILIGTGFREASWLMIGTVLGGFLLLEFSTSNLQRMVLAHLCGSPAPRMESRNALEQLAHANPKRTGELHDIFNPEVSFAALDPADVRPM